MDYSGYKSLKVEKNGKIATVTLNRPEQLNAIFLDLHTELEYIWVDIGRDEDVDIVILTGAGRAFSAGGDVKNMASRFGSVEGQKRILATPANAKRIVGNLLELDRPVISAINGDAIGLGATIALFCDISIIAENAKIADPHVKVGLVAGDGGAVIWPLLMGPNRAKEFLMCGSMLTGKQAYDMNLVNHALPADEVMPKAIALAQHMLSLPKWAVRWTKTSVNKQVKDQFNLIMDASIAYEMVSLATQDHGEAARAFAERRKPTFTGL